MSALNWFFMAEEIFRSITIQIETDFRPMRAQKGRSSSNESKAWMNLCFSGSDFGDVEDGLSFKYLVDKNLIDIVLNRIKTEGRLKVISSKNLKS